ncbi:MAG TPA: TolC family protein [Polyangia bacterium]|nr:TolC family protein [Polyangia bacterium]
MTPTNCRSSKVQPRALSAGLLVAALLTGGRAARAEAGGEAPIPARLSLADAERLFLEHGLDLLIAQYGAEGAEGDVKAAGAHPNPGLDVGTSWAPAAKHGLIYDLGPNASPTSTWGLSFGVSDNAALEDQLSGKRSLRIEAATKALAAARLNVGDVKRLGLAALRQAYVAAVMARLDVEAARESLDTYDKQLALNQKRYDEGAISGLDLSRATQAELEAQQTLDQARSGATQATAALLFLLGARGKAPEITLTTAIGYSVLSRLKDATLEPLAAEAEDNRPDAKIALANLEQAEVSVRQARRARFPDLSLSLGYSEQCSSGSCSSLPAFSAGVQGNVPLLYQQQGEIQRAESNQRAAQQRVNKVKAQVLVDVTEAFAAYAAAKSQVERMEGKLLEQAKVSRDLAQHMYQRGAASFIDFMDAQRAYVASRLEYNQDLANYWNAVYGLEQATGLPLREPGAR